MVDEPQTKPLNETQTIRREERTKFDSDYAKATAFLSGMQQKRREAMHCGQTGYWHWTLAGDQLYWDDTMFDVYGKRRENFDPAYGGFMECVYPEDRERVQAAVNACIESDEEYFYQFRVVDDEGKIRHIIGRGGCLRDENGKATVMAGTCIRVPALIA